MNDKNESEKLMEEFKLINREKFKKFYETICETFEDFLERQSLVKGEWEMKYPFKKGDGEFVLSLDGSIGYYLWENSEGDKQYFNQGNIFKTKEAAELEAKRRNLLTRFKAFRDECNGNWKVDFKNKTAKNEAKWNISYYNGKLQAACTNTFNDFVVFGYFKKREGPYVLSNCLVTKSKLYL